MKKETILFKNSYYEYALYVDEEGHLCHDYFITAGYVPKPENRERLKGEYPFEVTAALDWEGDYDTHIGGREYAYETCRDLIFREWHQEGDTHILRLENQKNSLEVLLYYEVHENSPAITRYTGLRNTGKEEKVINQVSSFALGNFPYSGKPEELFLHTYHSSWSHEGEEQVQSFPEMRMFSERSLNAWQIENNKSMTSCRYFPYVVLEDAGCGLFWGVQIENSGQWRMEIGSGSLENAGWFYLQGGLPNYRNSGWSKHLKPGEIYVTPKASLTVGRDSCDEIYRRMHRHQQECLIHKSVSDRSLPVIYNDWLSMRGEVNEKRILEQLPVLEEIGVEIYVTDAGWYVPPLAGWSEYLGCWEADPDKFPHGLKYVTDEIRRHKMLPGIWCEIESTAKYSPIFRKEEMLLKDHGRPIERCGRRFLDFRTKQARTYADRVITSFYEQGFRYVKIDYNADCTPGCDGEEESRAENLHQNRLAYHQWMDAVRRNYPDLIVEHCSSGGMRLDYDHLSQSCLASITDQEDVLHMAGILFQVTKLIHPGQCGNWSNIREGFDPDQARFSLTNSMMGRMCLSGVVSAFPTQIRQAVKEAVSFYKRYRDIIADPEVHYHTKPVRFARDQEIKIMEYDDREGKRALLFLSGVSKDGRIRIKPALRSRHFVITDAYPSLEGVACENDLVEILFPEGKPYGVLLALESA